VVLAIDDIHNSDEMSWRILQDIFESASNVVILATSCTTTGFSLRVDAMFWEKLNADYWDEGRFVQMELQGLNKEELRLMTMKALGLQGESIPQALLEEVVVQSGGVPRFAADVLEGIKERYSSGNSLLEKGCSVAEIILHRLDSLDISVRSFLNIGAILGRSFTLVDVVRVFQKIREAKEIQVRGQTVEAAIVAIREGILQHPGPQVESNLEDDTVFSFPHEVWYTTLIGLMLGSRKQYLHRLVALSMEDQLSDKDVETMEFRLRLHNHWKLAGDSTRATQSTLHICRQMEVDAELRGDCVILLEETLTMWGWTSKGARNASDAGFSSQLLACLDRDDLELLITLTVYFGRVLTSCGRCEEGASAYEDALLLMKDGKAGQTIRDRSIVFPAFVGLCQAIDEGVISDDSNGRYKETLLRRYIQETRIHGRLIHHIHALYLQFQVHVRKYELDKGLAVQSLIKSLYKPARHSKLLRKVYGQDSGALSFSQKAFIQMAQGKVQIALKTTRTTLKDLYPKIEGDLSQTFALVYPIVQVLRETGYSTEARSFFQRVILAAFPDTLLSVQSGVDLRPIMKPIDLVLSLSSKGPINVDEHKVWLTSQANVPIEAGLNRYLSRLGRCGESWRAEAMVLLARRLPMGKERSALIAQASQLIADAVSLTKASNFLMAQKQLYVVWQKLKTVKQ
jgi:hypothetical protein